MAQMYSPVRVLSSGDIVVLERENYYLIGRVEPRPGGGETEPFWLDTSVHNGDADRITALKAARALAQDQQRSVFLKTLDGALLQLHDNVNLDIKP
jgi:hypothetical protein